MKKIKNKDKLYIAYFALSWAPLAINDEAPLWAIALVVLNLWNAARLIKQVPLKAVNLNGNNASDIGICGLCNLHCIYGCSFR